MFVSHVSLEEVFVTELFIAQFAARLNVKYLDLTSGAGGRSEALLQIISRHSRHWGGGCHRRHPDTGEWKHEVWHSEATSREEWSVLCWMGPQTLLLWTLEELPAQHSET